MNSVLIKGIKEDVAKPIVTVSGVVEKKQTLPILSNVLIKKEGQKVSFIGSDLQIQISTDALIGTDEEDFSTTVSAKKLTEIFATIRDDDQVAISSSGTHIVIQAGRSKFELQTLESSNYPLMQEEGALEQAFTISCIKFKNMLNMVQFATAVNNVRFYLNGIYLGCEDKKVVTVGTDGHRLSYFECELDEPVQRKLEAILPKKTARELLRLIPDDDEPLHVSISEKQIKVSFGSVVIISKLIEGRFPDYQRVIPVGNDKEVIIDREILSLALRRVEIMTSSKVKNIRWNLSAGKLTVTSSNADQEEAHDEIPIEYAGGPLEIIFNVAYIQDMLNVVKAEKLLFSFNGPATPGLVRFTDSEQFKFVVMPIRM